VQVTQVQVGGCGLRP